MGNYLVCCDTQNVCIAEEDNLGHQRMVILFGGFEEHQVKESEANSDTTAASTPALSTAVLSHFSLNGDPNVVCGNVVGHPDAASETRSTQEGADVLNQTLENGSSSKPAMDKWGPYVSPLYISQFMQGGSCKLCQKNLSGALTIAMCGHTFHQRCVKTWRSNLCPICLELIDEPMGTPVDSTGAPVLPNGTPVMLQGLTVRSVMNGTYARIINYCDDLGRYTIWHKTSCGLYRVKAKYVVSIMLE